MLDREGVDLALFHQAAAHRLESIPAALRACAERMEQRSDESYRHAPTATLGTWRNFWAGRLPYFDANSIPGQFARFVVGLIDQAGGGGAHAGADLTRLQEVVRYGADARSESSRPPVPPDTA